MSVAAAPATVATPATPAFGTLPPRLGNPFRPSPTTARTQGVPYAPFSRWRASRVWSGPTWSLRRIHQAHQAAARRSQEAIHRKLSELQDRYQRAKQAEQQDVPHRGAANDPDSFRVACCPTWGIGAPKWCQHPLCASSAKARKAMAAERWPAEQTPEERGVAHAQLEAKGGAPSMVGQRASESLELEQLCVHRHRLIHAADLKAVNLARRSLVSSMHMTGPSDADGLAAAFEAWRDTRPSFWTDLGQALHLPPESLGARLRVCRMTHTPDLGPDREFATFLTLRRVPDPVADAALAPRVREQLDLEGEAAGTAVMWIVVDMRVFAAAPAAPDTNGSDDAVDAVEPAMLKHETTLLLSPFYRPSLLPPASSHSSSSSSPVAAVAPLRLAGTEVLQVHDQIMTRGNRIVSQTRFLSGLGGLEPFTLTMQNLRGYWGETFGFENRIFAPLPTEVKSKPSQPSHQSQPKLKPRTPIRIDTLLAQTWYELYFWHQAADPKPVVFTHVDFGPMGVVGAADATAINPHHSPSSCLSFPRQSASTPSSPASVVELVVGSSIDGTGPKAVFVLPPCSTPFDPDAFHSLCMADLSHMTSFDLPPPAHAAAAALTTRTQTSFPPMRVPAWFQAGNSYSQLNWTNLMSTWEFYGHRYRVNGPQHGHHTYMCYLSYLGHPCKASFRVAKASDGTITVLDVIERVHSHAVCQAHIASLSHAHPFVRQALTAHAGVTSFFSPRLFLSSRFGIADIAERTLARMLTEPIQAARIPPANSPYQPHDDDTKEPPCSQIESPSGSDAARTPTQAHQAHRVHQLHDSTSTHLMMMLNEVACVLLRTDPRCTILAAIIWSTLPAPSPSSSRSPKRKHPESANDVTDPTDAADTADASDKDSPAIKRGRHDDTDPNNVDNTTDTIVT